MSLDVLLIVAYCCLMTQSRAVWLTTSDVAERVQFSVHSVRDAAERGALNGCKVAGKWRFTEADVDAWMESHRVPSVHAARRRRAS